MEKNYAEIYIAFSRFKKLEDLCLIKYDEAFFDFSKSSKTARIVERETNKLQKLSVKTMNELQRRFAISVTAHGYHINKKYKNCIIKPNEREK